MKKKELQALSEQLKAVSDYQIKMHEEYKRLYLRELEKQGKIVDYFGLNVKRQLDEIKAKGEE